MTFKTFICLPCLCSLLFQPCVGHETVSNWPSRDTESFAQQYDVLADLLSKVKDRETALYHRDQIQQQIAFLEQNQSSGESAFNMLSKQEQVLFIKRFQNNRYHCGEVTQVMQERQRILLDPELASLLKDLLMEIP